MLDAEIVTCDVQDAEFQHGASVLAEWLDNDEDGCVDTPEVMLAGFQMLSFSDLYKSSIF